MINTAKMKVEYSLIQIISTIILETLVYSNSNETEDDFVYCKHVSNRNEE